jgi:hypothetical protein
LWPGLGQGYQTLLKKSCLIIPKKKKKSQLGFFNLPYVSIAIVSALLGALAANLLSKL